MDFSGLSGYLWQDSYILGEKGANWNKHLVVLNMLDLKELKLYMLESNPSNDYISTPLMHAIHKWTMPTTTTSNTKTRLKDIRTYGLVRKKSFPSEIIVM